MLRRRKFKYYAAHRGKDTYPEYHGEIPSRRVFHRAIFHHDRAEVTYSPFFRRMAFKQYHIADRGPENRTRLLHSIEVATVASGMARRLELNADLTEAIALGHDVAQPPCGYPADKILDEFLKNQGGFNHGLLGSQILQWNSKKPESKQFELLTKIPCYKVFKFDGTKMVSTLSDEAVNGIEKHSPPSPNNKYANCPSTLEGQIVRMADNLSYVSQEIDEGLRLDDKYKDILQGYATAPVLENIRTGEKKEHDELLRPQPGCPEDTHFLDNIFGYRLGPRLITMIKRIENYNKKMLTMNELKPKKTIMCDEKEIPIIRYDPVLEFIIDFIWDNFIGGVINKDRRVKKRVNENEKKIEAVLKSRLAKNPTNPKERKDFEEREKEVKYYFPRLSRRAFRKRAVAHHVATLTDDQVNKIYKGRR